MTVELPEHYRGYTKMLVRRLRLKHKSQLIERLIEEKVAKLFDTN